MCHDVDVSHVAGIKNNALPDDSCSESLARCSNTLLRYAAVFTEQGTTTRSAYREPFWHNGQHYSQTLRLCFLFQATHCPGSIASQKPAIQCQVQFVSTARTSLCPYFGNLYCHLCPDCEDAANDEGDGLYTKIPSSLPPVRRLFWQNTNSLSLSQSMAISPPPDFYSYYKQQCKASNGISCTLYPLKTALPEESGVVPWSPEQMKLKIMVLPLEDADATMGRLSRTHQPLVSLKDISDGEPTALKTNRPVFLKLYDPRFLYDPLIGNNINRRPVWDGKGAPWNLPDTEKQILEGEDSRQDIAVEAWSREVRMFQGLSPDVHGAKTTHCHGLVTLNFPNSVTYGLVLGRNQH